MENLTNITVVKNILQKHGFTFSKALGQNFLINPTVCPRIAEEGGAAPGTGVLEIGAGVGVLTNELAKRADKVVSVEIDGRLIPVLKETLAEHDNVTVLNEDVMNADLSKLLAEHFPGLRVTVCANLPYYITSPIIMRLLESRLPIERVTVMVQKEAARRLCALPGTREAGAVTMAVRYYSEPKQLFEVPRGSFMPQPTVDSRVIRLDIKKDPSPTVGDEQLFFKIIRGAFSQRRKTLCNSLSAALGISKAETAEVLAAAKIPESARPEQLTIEQFAAVSEEISRLNPSLNHRP